MSVFTILTVTLILVAFEVMIGIKLPWLRKLLTKYPILCIPFSVILGTGLATMFHAGGTTLMIPSLANMFLMAIIYKNWDAIIERIERIVAAYCRFIAFCQKVQQVFTKTSTYVQDVADVIARNPKKETS